MATEQTRLHLEDIARAFARWRSKKRRPGDPVPESLWRRAVDAARVHGTTKTGRRLRLNHSALKQRIERSEAATQDFVELPLGLMASSEAIVEVEDTEGTRLRLILRGAKPHEAAAAARELWTARS